MKLNLTLILLTAAFALQTAGCVKKRPDMISPTHTDPTQYREIPKAGNIDGFLNSIEDPALSHIKGDSLQGHVIITGETATLGDLSDAANVVISKDTGFDFPHYVDFSTNSPLLAGHQDEIKLYGVPGTEYKVRYELTPKFLKIYKEIPESQLTHYEAPYSKNMGDGKWWVPVGGYGVTYFLKKHNVNADNRKTNIIDYYSVPAENFKTATHYRLDRESFIPFQRVTKTNIFPFEYFTGDWYFATTIVSTRQGQESSMGYFDSAIDSSLRAQATRIKFLRGKDFLRAVNVVVDDRAHIPEDQLNDALNIPAKWFDYRVQTDGKYESLAEEYFPANDFSQRKYVELDFKLVKAIAVDGNNSAAQTADYFRGLELSDIKFSKDTFSFTVHTVASGIKRKYSFMRLKESDYKPRVYFKEDSKYFGLFKTQKFKLIDINSYGEGDSEKDVLINRFHPKKNIVFRFSNHTPKLARGEKDVYGLNMDYRKIGANAVAYWNRVFELVGAQARVVLDDQADNELGDFEYNTINIITNLADDGSGGVGPTIADPITGEIINGTVNVYVATTIANLSRDLNKVLNIERDLIKDTVFSEAISQRPVMGGLVGEVRHFCPELINYAHKTKKQIFNDAIADTPYINACLEKIAPKRIEAITVHEMGHTLGLRHNFYGSYDKQNSITSIKELKELFPPNRFPDLHKYLPNDQLLGRTSSAMDYFMTWFSGDNGTMSVTPSYSDFYTIAYAYAEKIPVAGGNRLAFRPIDTSKDLSSQRNGMRATLYCTDEQAMFRAGGESVIDPACALHDYGQSYKEILDYNFDKYRDDVVVGMKKIGRQYFTASGSQRSRALVGMATVYSNWRYNLRSFLKDPNDTTLINYDEQEFEALMQRVKASNSKIAQDVGVSDVYYKYMMEILSMSNYYCVTRVKGTDQINIREFSDVQEKFINLTEDLTVSSCMDDIVKQSLAQPEYNEEVITELGTPIQNVKFSKKLEDMVDTPDLIGVGGDRLMVAELLAGINSKLLRPTASVGLSPSILNEPKFYKDFKLRTMKRIFTGLDISDRVNFALKAAGSSLKVEEGTVFKKFKEEYNIYMTQVISLLKSNVGSNGISKTAELRDFNVMPAQRSFDIPNGALKVKIGPVYYYTAPSSQFSGMLFDRYKVMNNPLYVRLGQNASTQNMFEAVLELAKDLPVAFNRTDYVSKMSDLEILWRNMQLLLEENSNNQAISQELMFAFAPYQQAFSAIGLFSQAVVQGEQSKQEEVEFEVEGSEEKIKVNVAEAKAILEKLQASNIDADLAKTLGLQAPVTQFGVVSSYLGRKSPQAQAGWAQAAAQNIKYVEDFEGQESTFYKQFLESIIKQFSEISLTR